MRSVIFAVVSTLLVMGLHYVPNRYCLAVTGLPCDINQK